MIPPRPIPTPPAPHPAPRRDGWPPVDVPGYHLEGPLGYGGAGEVRAARDADGRRVAVHLVADSPGVRRRAAALLGVTHPHLLRLTAMEDAGDGRLAVIGEAHPGTTLGDVLAVRRQLTDPEVAGLLDGLGHGLGRLHEVGLTHGDLTADNVLIAADGRPILADLLTAPDAQAGRSTAPERAAGGAGGGAGGAPADAASDVWDLATLLTECCPSGSPARRVLAPALHEDPARRPSARDLAARAPAIGAARPVTLPAGADLAPALLRARPTPTPRAGARGAPRPGSPPPRRARSLLARCVAGAAVGVALGFAGFHALVAVGVFDDAADPPARLAQRPSDAAAGGTADDSGTTPAPDAAPAPDAQRSPAASGRIDPAGLTVAVADLIARRDAALRDMDPAALAALSVPGGPAADEDRRLLADLAAAGERPVELRTDVVSVEALEADAGGAEAPLRVRTQIAQRASVRETPDGTRAIPALPPRCVDLHLRHDAVGGLVLESSRPCA